MVVCCFVLFPLPALIHLGFPGRSAVKNLPVMQEMWAQSPSWNKALEEPIASHSYILARKTSWPEEPSRLQCMWSQRTGHDWSDWARTHWFTCCFYFFFLNEDLLQIWKENTVLNNDIWSGKNDSCCQNWQGSILHEINFGHHFERSMY